MEKKINWKEGYRQVKKIIERLVKAQEKKLQPVLQPIRPRQRF
ncbi:MAG: hypothetical protein ABIR18_15325 [Chitinophagaceae bacterium]